MRTPFLLAGTGGGRMEFLVAKKRAVDGAAESVDYIALRNDFDCVISIAV